AASSEIDEKYVTAVEKMGEELAQRGHNLVFGAGGQGLMGAAARGFKKGKAHIIGVIPEFFKEAEVEVIYEECDELIYTDTMRERKAKMEDLADAFIIVPGGIGTFEELFEVLTLKQLGRHKKAIALYNVDGYYDSMESMLEHSIDEHFVRENCKMLYSIFSDLQSMIDYLEADIQIDFTVKQLKNG
ncbi:MAG: TIGR00730 family Rossman fold protein, partial [Eubacterium sp.]|nr:TIGR00730 family Rossman fold protein [Eubacterium sp.]